MSYVPPSKRSKQIIDNYKVAQDTSEKNYPALSGTHDVSVSNNSASGSYAEQAMNWKKQKEEFDNNQRTEEYMNEHRKQKLADEKLEAELMFPQIKRIVHVQNTVEAKKLAPTSDPNAWTVVSRRKRRERRDVVNFEEAPEEQPDMVAEDEEDTMWR